MKIRRIVHKLVTVVNEFNLPVAQHYCLIIVAKATKQ